MKITVRNFRKKDSIHVQNMMNKLANFHGDTIKTTPKDFAKYCLGAKKLAHCRLAWHKKEPVGFIISYSFINFVRGFTCQHIDLIFVEDKFRRQNVGKALIQAVALDAVAVGHQRLSVAAQTSNIGANKFYQKLGFSTKTSTSVNYNVQDDKLLLLSELENTIEDAIAWARK